VEETMVHLTLTARHLELTESLRTYIEEKVRRIERYSVKPVSAMVTLIIESYRHIVDISLNMDGTYVQAKVESNEMYGSIDKAIEKIERQMKNVQTVSERSGPDSSIDEILDIPLADDAESSASERHSTPKTTWAFGPIEPLC
jgi:putative sigma-54 modulation protein